jgi:hypothetical protein
VPAGGHVRVNWHLPLNHVEVLHPPVDVNFPLLREVTVEKLRGDAERVKFWLTSRLPSYNWNYDAVIVGPGTGEPVDLGGNQFLRFQFLETYAHTEAGDSSIASAPGRPLLGYQFLRDWVLAGDFEAAVDIGIGLSSAAPLEVRVVEGEDRGLFWVAVDFREP